MPLITVSDAEYAVGLLKGHLAWVKDILGQAQSGTPFLRPVTEQLTKHLQLQIPPAIAAVEAWPQIALPQLARIRELRLSVEGMVKMDQRYTPGVQKLLALEEDLFCRQYEDFLPEGSSRPASVTYEETRDPRGFVRDLDTALRFFERESWAKIARRLQLESQVAKNWEGRGQPGRDPRYAIPLGIVIFEITERTQYGFSGALDMIESCVNQQGKEVASLDELARRGKHTALRCRVVSALCGLRSLPRRFQKRVDQERILAVARKYFEVFVWDA